MEPIRILYSSHDYLPPLINGRAIFVKYLAEGMAARGHEVLILVPRIDGTSYPDHKNGLNIQPVFTLHAAMFHPELYVSIITRPEIDRLFDRFKPQILHIHDISPLSQSLNARAREVGLPVIITHHQGPEATGSNLRRAAPVVKKIVSDIVLKMLVRHLNRADLVTVPSHYSQRMLLEQGVKTNIQRVPCGIRLDLFQPKPGIDRAALRERYGLDREKLLLLYVGRIDIEKNIQTLLHGMALLDHPSIQLAIAGKGPEEKWLRGMAARLGVESRVAFLGNIPQPELPDLLNSTDIFTMPSGGESFSIATLEAMACGRPILAANGAALPELVTHLENGYLFQPDDPCDLKVGIERLVERRDEWPSMAQHSLKKAGEFGLEQFLDSVEHIYQAYGHLHQ